MISRIDSRPLLLALLVAVSHIALVSHVTAHFEPALEQCELCVSQAQPLAAIPSPENRSALLPVPTPVRPGHPSPSKGCAVSAPYQQRAPPLPSP